MDRSHIPVMKSQEFAKLFLDAGFERLAILDTMEMTNRRIKRQDRAPVTNC
jgi:hypothetical protein